ALLEHRAVAVDDVAQVGATAEAAAAAPADVVATEVEPAVARGGGPTSLAPAHTGRVVLIAVDARVVGPTGHPRERGHAACHAEQKALHVRPPDDPPSA